MSVWSEAENRDAIRLYLQLLHAEEAGQKPNKAEIYRALNRLHPSRSVKAFERKFQNISAILYENKLPYCSGLKPLFHYQRLLRLQLLDQIDRTPVPAVEPHEILRRKLKDLKAAGDIPVRNSGTGRYGLAIEAALGIVANSSKQPDFMGIELKTKSDGSLQTLFSRTPSRFTGVADKKELFSRYSYADINSKQRLSTSFGSVSDSLGFSMRVSEQVIQVSNRGQSLFEYEAERIEEALLSKHSQSVFLQVRGRDGSCKIDSALYCQWPSVIRFLQLVNSGKVNLDLTLSQRGSSLRDHGFLWRIAGEDLSRLYLRSERLVLE